MICKALCWGAALQVGLLTESEKGQSGALKLLLCAGSEEESDHVIYCKQHYLAFYSRGYFQDLNL